MKKTVSLATLVGTCLGNFPIPGQCYSFVKEGSTWEAMPPESSKYQRLRLKQSNAIWAVLKRKHKSGKGYQIGKYDTEKSIEEVDIKLAFKEHALETSAEYKAIA